MPCIDSANQQGKQQDRDLGGHVENHEMAIRFSGIGEYGDGILQNRRAVQGAVAADVFFKIGQALNEENRRNDTRVKIVEHYRVGFTVRARKFRIGG